MSYMLCERTSKYTRGLIRRVYHLLHCLPCGFLLAMKSVMIQTGFHTLDLCHRPVQGNWKTHGQRKPRFLHVRAIFKSH